MLFPIVTAIASSILIKGGTVVDGSGKPGQLADVRIQSGKIVKVGRLTALPDETVVFARGKVVCPGFVDAHSHADGALDKLESQVRQGITTAVVGQDGSSDVSGLIELFHKGPPCINFASFSGHGTCREAAMGADFARRATGPEIAKMSGLVKKDMGLGALGLSSGLEYDPGHYATTDELVEVARATTTNGGMYISHVRDEGNGAMASFREVLEISRRAKVPAQVSHIKLATAKVWGLSKKSLKELETSGSKVTLDVYPYTYWQSTVTALTVSRDFDNPETWRLALADIGGAKNVRVTKYVPDPTWQGKTLQQIAELTGKPAPDLIVEMVKNTSGQRGQESILCQAMREDDLINFIRSKQSMFCSDGQGGGSHPRSAGSFPRVFAEYVRKNQVLTLQEAVRKMTSFPCQIFGFKRRGLIKSGYFADVVVFDPKTIQDNSTPNDPTKMATGVSEVLVSGKFVVRGGRFLGGGQGKFLRRN